MSHNSTVDSTSHSHRPHNSTGPTSPCLQNRLDPPCGHATSNYSVPIIADGNDPRAARFVASRFEVWLPRNEATEIRMVRPQDVEEMAAGAACACNRCCLPVPRAPPRLRRPPPPALPRRLHRAPPPAPAGASGSLPARADPPRHTRDRCL